MYPMNIYIFFPISSWFSCEKQPFFHSKLSIFVVGHKYIGDSSVGIVTGYGMDDGRNVIRFPGWARTSVTKTPQTDTGARASSCAMNTGTFPGASGQGVALTPTPSSADVKERVEMYLYSSTGPLRNLTFIHLTFIFCDFKNWAHFVWIMLRVSTYLQNLARSFRISL
jgi:hypothetical protein